MEITYKNNKNDIHTYAEYIFKSSVFSRKKFIYYNLILGAFIIFIIYVQSITNNISINNQYWLLSMAFLSILIIQYIFKKAYINNFVKAYLINNKENNNIYIKIDRNIYITYNNIEINSDLRFDSKLIKYKDNYFLTVNKKITLIIPNRVFTSTKDEEIFNKEICSRLNFK